MQIEPPIVCDVQVQACVIHSANSIHIVHFQGDCFSLDIANKPDNAKVLNKRST